MSRFDAETLHRLGAAREVSIRTEKHPNSGVVIPEDQLPFETDFCRLHNGSRSRDSFLSRRRTDRSTKRPRPLEAENAKLKRLLADAMLDNTALKDLFGKMVTPVVPGSNLVSVRAIRGSSFGQ